MKHAMESAFYSGLMLLAIEACSDSTQFKATGSPDGSIYPASPAQADVISAESSLNAERDGKEPVSKTAGTPATTTTVTDVSVTLPSGPLSAAEEAASRYRQQCSSSNKKTITQRIKFPETENCRFNQAGNLPRLDAHLQAVESQNSRISLPDKSQLCDLGVSSPSATIQYDDFMILTLNGYVLLSSNSKILSNLETSANSALQWDFNRIKGTAVDFSAPAYCLSNGSSLCVVPETDVPGKFQFNIDPSSLIKLADKVIDNNILDFSLLATGDNDDKDCWHTEVTLDFTLQYVEKP